MILLSALILRKIDGKTTVASETVVSAGKSLGNHRH
jgi:hypothetical protein